MKVLTQHDLHCAKHARIRLFLPLFSRIREITGQRKPISWHILRIIKAVWLLVLRNQSYFNILLAVPSYCHLSIKRFSSVLPSLVSLTLRKGETWNNYSFLSGFILIITAYRIYKTDIIIHEHIVKGLNSAPA